MIVARLVGPGESEDFKLFKSLLRARLFAKKHKVRFNWIELYLADAIGPRTARQALIAGLGRLLEVIEATPAERVAGPPPVLRRRRFAL